MECCKYFLCRFIESILKGGDWVRTQELFGFGIYFNQRHHKKSEHYIFTLDSKTKGVCRISEFNDFFRMIFWYNRRKIMRNRQKETLKHIMHRSKLYWTDHHMLFTRNWPSIPFPLSLSLSLFGSCFFNTFSVSQINCWMPALAVRDTFQKRITESAGVICFFFCCLCVCVASLTIWWNVWLARIVRPFPMAFLVSGKAQRRRKKRDTVFNWIIV